MRGWMPRVGTTVVEHGSRPLQLPLSSFRRKPGPSAFARGKALGPGFRRDDEVKGVRRSGGIRALRAYASVASILVLIAVLWLSTPRVHAATPDDAGENPPAASAEVEPAQVPWSDLTPTEQDLLAPVSDQWQQLTPHQQQRLRRKAERWQDLGPVRREIVQQRLSRFATMTPEQRAAARQRFKAFQQLPPEQKARMREAFRRYHALPPEQRRELRERFENSQPAQQP